MKKSACTTLLIGRKAAHNRSIMICRSEDHFGPLNPKRFEYIKGDRVPNRLYHDNGVDLDYPLPEDAAGYTRMVDADAAETKNGDYGEAGINSYGVAMSATESLYGNPRVLAYDPLVKNGVSESALLDVVLPFIKTAREGVLRVGDLIARYGSAEGNGIAFADENELWYMEIPCGHHWVAVKIPDDSYAVAPNHVVIERVNLQDHDHIMCSEGLEDFVNRHQLNREKKFNFRKIFGTYSDLDQIYNCPRAWYMHKILSGETKKDPCSPDHPFIKKPRYPITEEDIIRTMSSHYEGTVYDPLGSEENGGNRTRFRPISLSRTAHTHILQLRDPHAYPIATRALQWISLGTAAYNPFVPFFTHISDTPAAYRDTPAVASLDSAYWIAKFFGYYAEHHRRDFDRETRALLDKLFSTALTRIDEITCACPEDLEAARAYLTAENEKTSALFTEKIKEQLRKYATRALADSLLSFKMDKNL